MIIYLAGIEPVENYFNSIPEDTHILSSFFYHKNKKVIQEWAFRDNHILDSGAFSTFKNPKDAAKIDWNRYVKTYIEFIKKTDKKLFFEIDVDMVLGLDKVEYYRNQIADAVGRQPIPVWHSNRGWDYFCKMTEEYPYVALGTTSAAKDGRAIRKNPAILDKFIKQAHSKKSKIHGLGFTHIDWLKLLKFDSVDSTTWLSGPKFGTMYQFLGDGNFIQHKRPEGKVMINPKGRFIHNFNEWRKYQKWAYKNL